MSGKILIVDDSRAMRSSIRFVLEQDGMEVLEAEDGKEALEILGDHTFGLVISDINMPIMDGIRLTQAIRAGEGGVVNRRVPILILTTESQLSRMEEGKGAGASGWIVKPFEMEKLVKAVHKLLR